MKNSFRLFLALCMMFVCTSIAKAQSGIKLWKGGICMTVFTNDIDSITFFGEEHEYVDLGLPSGTLWATCNVGADSPEEYGDYFAWGETSTKDQYLWENYKYCNGDKYSMTKYCVDSAHGTVDDKTILDPEDDAAYVNWGCNWRMPTDAEMRELLANCTYSVVTINNVVGCKFVSTINGNSIFLPAAGYSSYEIGKQKDVKGFYYSSSLYTSDSCEQYSLAWGDEEGNPHMKGSFRYWGRSIRPVRSK